MLYICDICDYSTNKKFNLEKHEKTNRHIKKVLKVSNKPVSKNNAKTVPSGAGTVPNGAEITQNYCEKCDRNFSSKGVLNRHLYKKHGIDKRVNNQGTPKSLMPKTGITADNRHQNIPNFNQKIADIPKDRSISCKYCNTSFAHMSSLYRHNNRCKVKKEKLLELENLKQENKEIKSELKQKDKIIENTTKANKYAMSTFNYLAKTFVNTPALRRARGEQIDTIMYNDHNTEDDFKLVECLVYYHRFKRLHEYIGDTIVAIYKKDDPKTQSIWNSDTQRLSYIIRTIVDDDIEWKRDNGGKKVLKMVINPILKYIQQKVRDYIMYLPEEDYHPKKFNEMIREADKLSREFIDNTTLARTILGYITPYFRFDTNNLLGLEGFEVLQLST